MRQWVSQEDDFVLKQSKKKAKIRVREGRAKPVDWLAVCLGVVDQSNDILEEESAQPDFDVPEPSAVISGLGQAELATLGKDIDHYLALESGKENRTYWSVRQSCRSLSNTADCRTGCQYALQGPSGGTECASTLW